MPYFHTSDPGSLCVECDLGAVGGALRCADCSGVVHLSCSGLSKLFLVRFVTTRAQFACSACVKAKAGDKLQEVLGEVELILGREKTDQENANETNGDDSKATIEDLSENRTGSPSAPPASQMPATQAGVIGGETWASVGRMEAGVAKSSENPPAHHNPREETNASRACVSARGAKEAKRPKRGICRYYKSGSCKFGAKGENCKFEHPKKCFKFIKFGREERRGCGGAGCDYYHPPLCNWAESGRECRRQNCKYFHRKAALSGFRGNKAQDKRTTENSLQQRLSRSGDAPGRNGKTYSAVTAAHNQPVAGTGYVGDGIYACAEEVPVRGHETNHSEQVDFRLLLDQVARMERQLHHLINIGGRVGSIGQQGSAQDYRGPYF